MKKSWRCFINGVMYLFIIFTMITLIRILFWDYQPAKIDQWIVYLMAITRALEIIVEGRG